MLSKNVKLLIKRLFAVYTGVLVVLLIAAIGFPVSAQILSPSKILLNFSEPMSRENIFDPFNYKVTANENTLVSIIKVGIVEGDSSVVLFFNKEDGWLSFKITVQNLKDKAGNLINVDKNIAYINTASTKVVSEEQSGK